MNNSAASRIAIAAGTRIGHVHLYGEDHASKSRGRLHDHQRAPNTSLPLFDYIPWPVPHCSRDRLLPDCHQPLMSR